MNAFATISILCVAFVLVFAQSTFNFCRAWIGAQPDLLPSLMVYASLSSGLPTITLLAFTGGLLLDSVSANPLGVSVLPLFLIGFVIQLYRGLILREQTYAQVLLGLAASAGAPVLTILLLLNLQTRPLLSWFSLWQLLAVTAIGGVMTPLWFGLFDRLSGALNYRRLEQTAFRPDREIKRGRK